MPANYGRDPRRRLTPGETRLLYERANGMCQRCGEPLDASWHGAHLTSYVHGGATSVEQMEAWCWRCNLKLGPRDAENAPVFTPRVWQEAALRPILQALHQHGVATLHAAPGAGKTFEIAWIFQQLYDAGHVQRLVVVVPKLTLIDQWVEELGLLGIHLDKTPRDGYIELQGTAGCVVCYASLPGTARNHAIRMDQIPTLWVWDEVHHLAEKAPWGQAAREAAGDIQTGGIEHAVAVINATGTLFRSNKSERIATVRYRDVVTEDGEQKIQAVEDFSVRTADLLGVELRRPDLYTYSGHAQLLDLATEEVVAGEIADLDKQQRQAVMRESFTSRAWLRGFCEEALLLLRRQSLVFEDQEPLKLLYVAKDIRAARAAADMINEVTGKDFARLIVNDEPGARRALKAAKHEPRACAIVAVQMVTEGFDCSHIATIAYASNKIADLFIAQMMARAMRVTGAERAAGRMLPAQILIPDNPDLRKAFASALASALHEVTEDEEHCHMCGQPKPCLCPKPPPPPGPLPRYALLGLDDPRLRAAVVLDHDDGEVNGTELNDEWLPACADLGIPSTYAPRVAVASRRVRPKVPVYSRDEAPPQRAPANPRDINLQHRAQVDQAARWMSHHIGHDDRFDTVGAFQTAINKAAGIPFDDKGKGMRDLAKPPQLRAAANWARERIAEHCRLYGCQPPAWLNEEDG